MRTRELTLFDPHAATMSVVGLELHRDLTQQECIQGAEQLGKIDRASRWVWGDLLIHMERTYGDGYRALGVHSELDYQSLANCKLVADAIDISRRRENLSWSHHEAVAALDVEQQEYWLTQAELHHWSLRELRARLKATRQKRLPTHTPLLRFCQDLPTPIIVSQILRVYFPDAESVLDLTAGDGGFWDGSELVDVTRLIVDPTLIADGRDGPDFRDVDVAAETYDVVVFDPPHVGDAGDGSVMGDRFGTYEGEDLEDAIRRGCAEAWRIGRLGAIVKVTDHVHGQRYVLESDWVRDAIGEAPYDEVYQVRSSAVVDPKWHEQLSAYNNGSTYLIFRKGQQKHVRRGVEVAR